MNSVRMGDLVESVPIVQTILEFKTSIAFGMAMNELTDAIQPHLANFNTARNALIEKYAVEVRDVKGDSPKKKKKDGNNEQVQRVIPSEHKADFAKEYEELENVSVTLALGKLPISVLDKEGIKLTAQEAHTLRWLLKNDSSVFVED